MGWRSSWPRRPRSKNWNAEHGAGEKSPAASFFGAQRISKVLHGIGFVWRSTEKVVFYVHKLFRRCSKSCQHFFQEYGILTSSGSNDTHILLSLFLNRRRPPPRQAPRRGADQNLSVVETRRFFICAWKAAPVGWPFINYSGDIQSLVNTFFRSMVS